MLLKFKGTYSNYIANTRFPIKPCYVSRPMITPLAQQCRYIVELALGLNRLRSRPFLSMITRLAYALDSSASNVN